MMPESAPDVTGGLPRALGDGLTLRWATPADIEAVAEHSVRHLSDHVSDQPAEPNEELRGWTRELMNGTHPTTRAGDFTVVVDAHAGDRIVSTLCLIPQTWAYAGIPFKVGRPEIVSTSPAYRRRGLVRAQFAAIHARSAARGDLVLAITGIAWYYRQFGYEMTLTLGGSRLWLPLRIPPALPGAPPAYRLRPATLDDLPVLAPLYAIHCNSSLVARVRDAAEWRYEMAWKKFWMVEDVAGTAVGYAEAGVNNGDDDPELRKVFTVNELAVRPGQSLAAVLEFLGPAFGALPQELNPAGTQTGAGLTLNLGPAHPGYIALGTRLEAYRPAWTWYIRVPNLPAFVRHIAPALERRLAGSVMAGHSGTLRLNFYRNQMALVFQQGRLVEVGTYTPTRVEDGDAHFPDLTFLHLLFGHRTLAEVRYLFPDCYATAAAGVLLGILFPSEPSNPIPLS